MNTEQEPTLRVSETFYSIQGEGVTMGAPSFFIRLQACNLMCGGRRGQWVKEGRATWHCDTEEVWKYGNPVRFQDLLQDIHDCGTRIHLVWTGGEPMLQAKTICAFLDYMGDNKYFNEVETNGTLFGQWGTYLSRRVQQFNVSPKLSNSGVLKSRRYNEEALKWFIATEKAWFKFVVSQEKDVTEIMKEWDLIPRDRIILMPAASTRKEMEFFGPQVASWAKSMGWRYSSRLQVDLWDKTTGV